MKRISKAHLGWLTTSLLALTPMLQAAIVTGPGSPADYTSPNPLVVQNFVAAHPHGLTQNDLLTFSADVVHNKQADAGTVLPVVPPTGQESGPSTDAAATNSQWPCPEGFSATHRYASTGLVTCEQTTQMSPTLELDTNVTMNAYGGGFMQPFNIDDNSFMVGTLIQTVIDPSQGFSGVIGSYANYFLSDPNQATTLAQGECNAGLIVTYDGASASGGYQVQIVQGNSPIPPGARNICSDPDMAPSSGS